MRVSPAVQYLMALSIRFDEHLRDQVAVAQNMQIGRAVQGAAQAFVFGERLIKIPDFGCHGGQIDGQQAAAAALIGLGARDVEKRVEHPDGAAHLGPQIGGKGGLALDLRQFLHHAVQRGAQFVRDGVGQTVRGAVEVFDTVKHGVDMGFQAGQIHRGCAGREDGR